MIIVRDEAISKNKQTSSRKIQKKTESDYFVDCLQRSVSVASGIFVTLFHLDKTGMIMIIQLVVIHSGERGSESQGQYIPGGPRTSDQQYFQLFDAQVHSESSSIRGGFSPSPPCGPY